MTENSLILPDLSPVNGLDMHARFDGGSLSSDGGVLMLREIEKELKFGDALAACLRDERDPRRTRHGCSSMIRSRLMAIACGYEDCNDHDELRDDPAFKMACERLPDTDHALASQPTLSRLENTASWRQLVRMGLALIDLHCFSFRTVPRHVVLDIDDTTDRTHGAQQLSLFNTHAGGCCFQPIHIYDAASQKPVCFILRPGKRPAGEEVALILRHVIRRIQQNLPRVAITVRGDGHHGTPEVMDLLERNGCFHVLGLTGNSILKQVSLPWCDDVATRRARCQKPKFRRFFQTTHGARSWSRKRRVIARVEATEQGTDVRHIVTNVPGRGKYPYERLYCARGKMENLIKEHKLYTKSDRTSCHRWEANQFRPFPHTGACWPLLRLRGAAPKRSRWRGATFETIRRAFLKIAVRVEQLKTRVRIALPTACPHQEMLVLLATRVRAQSP